MLPNRRRLLRRVLLVLASAALFASQRPPERSSPAPAEVLECVPGDVYGA
jgi:hypothetical protein